MDDVEFYEHQVKFQENLAKIQQKRSILEQEFFNLAKTDKKLQSIRTTKLRNYWKKVCERERKAQVRNEALLRDVKEFEERLSKVAADTARLEKIKEKCENELTKIYPQWRYEIDLTKAKKQLEDNGMNLDSQFPTSLSSILNAPRGSVADQVEAPLFKLVPYNYERESAAPSVESHSVPAERTSLSEIKKDQTSSQIVQSASATSKPLVPEENLISSSKSVEKMVASRSSYNSLSEAVSASKQKTSNKELQSLLKPETSKVVKQNVNFSTLKVFPDNVSTSSLETSSEAPYIPRLELKSINRNESAYSEATSKPQKHISVLPTGEFLPDPISSFHRNPDVDDVRQVEINETKPKDDFLKDLSDVSSVSTVSTPKSPALERVDSEGQINFPAKKADDLQPYHVFSSTVAKEFPNILSPKTSEPIKIPIPSVESLPSESVTTEPSQKGLPLTSNPAYQNMLKSSEMSSTFGMSHHFEENDDDELEKIVSPKPKEFSLSDDSDDDEEEEHDDDKGAESSFNKSKASEHLSSEKNTPKKPSFLASSFTTKKQKAPWDTDSGEEDSYKIPKAGQTFSADEDDFDFYD